MNLAPHLKSDVASQLEGLRQFNTSLLEEVADLRKGEIEHAHLQTALAEQQAVARQQKEELARKLSALTDENWAKSLEIESLEVIRRKDLHELQDLKSQLTDLHAKIEELSWLREQDIGAHADETQRLARQNLQNIETFRAFEQQSNNELARVRVENADLHKNFGDLRSGLKSQLDALANDNTKLRHLLNVRDTQNAERSENLTIWQHQLTELDQHLSHTKGAMKHERTNLLHIAMQFEKTIRLVAAHPFKDYIEVTEREIVRLQSQLTSVSDISPLRPKIEDRLAQLKQQSTAMRAGLSELDHKQNERLSAVAAITKSLSAIPEFEPALEPTAECPVPGPCEEFSSQSATLV